MKEIKVVLNDEDGVSITADNVTGKDIVYALEIAKEMVVNQIIESDKN